MELIIIDCICLTGIGNVIDFGRSHPRCCSCIVAIVVNEQGGVACFLVTRSLHESGQS